MARDNETMADVAKEALGFECGGFISAERVKFIVSDIVRRFEAAHNRELLKFRENLKDACAYLCNSGSAGCGGAFDYGSRCCENRENCLYRKLREPLAGGEKNVK